jgi:hypothetical protein
MPREGNEQLAPAAIATPRLLLVLIDIEGALPRGRSYVDALFSSDRYTASVSRTRNS